LENKICLGTAQFGLDYGISNKSGKVAKNEVFKILEYVCKEGIKSLDTAHSYGASEEVIGDFIQDRKCEFKITSKLPAINKFEEADIKKLFFSSLERLKINKIHAYLIHKFDDFMKYEKMWFVLESLKKEGLIQKLGFSLYWPQELDLILEKKINFDIVQVPFSIFDRRFENYFKKLKDSGVEINIRSVFLQGLVFLDVNALPNKVKKAREHLLKLNRVSEDTGISIAALCLNFALCNESIDKVVIGVDSLEHLKSNLKNITVFENVRNIYGRLGRLSSDNEDFLLPFNWSQG
jgi:aryl-alcohol dehydrogenase-like predicted oxidoreductase